MNPIETPPLGARPELFNQPGITDSVDRSYNSTLSKDTSPDDLDQFFSFEAFNEDLSEDFNLLLAEDKNSSLSQHRASRLLDKTTSEIDVRDLRCIPTTQEVSKPAAISVRPRELDMNDPYVLAIYTQLVIFEQDLTKHDVTFSQADYSTQDTLHSLARRFGLEYEYSLQFQRVRISRIKGEQPSGIYFSDLGHASIASGTRRLPDTPPDEILLPTYAEHGPMSSPNNYIEKTSVSTQWEEHLLEGSQNLYSSDVNLDLGSHYTPTELEVFDPRNETSGSRGRYDGSQPMPPTLVPRPSLNRTFSRFNAEASKIKEPPVNLLSIVMNNDNAALSTQKIRVLNVHDQSRIPYSEDGTASTDLAQVSEKIAEVPHIPSTSPTSNLRQSESQPADQYQNVLTFITDTSAITLKPSTAIRRGETRNGMERIPSAGPKFAACWKCKALRKRCDSQSPCACCLKGDHDSIWKTVGCRRGPLGCQLPRAVFCQARRETVGQIALFSNTSKLSALENHVGPKATLILQGSSHQIRDGRLVTCSGQPLDLNSTGATLPALRSEIQELIWTLRRGFNSNCVNILKEAGLHDLEFSFMLRSAERAFANSPNNKLIVKSLVCLKSILYLLGAIAYDREFPAHEECASTFCLVDHSRYLENHIRDYVNELSREMFNKKNLRGDKSWWLPAFYSLCIQSFVGKTLLPLLDSTPSSNDKPAAPYLHLAVHLFEALASGFDPITQNQDADGLSGFKVDRFITMMRRMGLKNSFEYIRYLFKMDGGITSSSDLAQLRDQFILEEKASISATLGSHHEDPTAGDNDLDAEVIDVT